MSKNAGGGKGLPKGGAGKGPGSKGSKGPVKGFGLSNVVRGPTRGHSRGGGDKKGPGGGWFGKGPKK